MRRSSSRPNLFGVQALAVMGLLAIALLYVVHPREAFFDQIGSLEKPDALSLAYLTVLLNSDSDNKELRYRLAQMQSDVGESEQAMATLRPLLHEPTVSPKAVELALTLAIQKLAAATDEHTRAERKADLLVLVERLIGGAGAHPRVNRSVETVLGWLTPDEQLSLLPTLISSAEGQDRLWLVMSLGHAQVAAGNPADAAETLAGIIDQLPAEEQGKAARELVRLYLASGQPVRALDTFQARNLMSPGAAGLQEAIQLARLAGKDGLERQWLESLMRQYTADITELRRLRALQLGQGDLAQAAMTAERVAGMPAAVVEDRIWAARVWEWRGQPEKALARWQSLYLSAGHPEALQRATALAQELFRWPELVKTLETARARGELGADGYLVLGDAYTRAVELDKAVAVLEEGQRKYPSVAGFKDRLYQLYVNNNRYLDAIALFEQQDVLSEGDRLVLANLYWRTRRVERAFETLSVSFQNPDFAAEAELMRLDLLTMLGDVDKIRAEYSQLMAGSWRQHGPGVADRLIGLAAQFGDYERVAELARYRFQRTGNARYIPILADAQANTGQWEALERTLAQWRSDPAHRQDGLYWTFRGRLFEQRGKAGDAEKAYRQALRLNPGNEDILSAWGWLLVAEPQRKSDKLNAILTELSSQSGQRQYALLAYGYSALGQDKRSRYWLQKWRTENAVEPRALEEQAGLAQSLGDEASSFHLRRLAARQVPRRVEPRTPSRQRSPDELSSGYRAQPVFGSENRAAQLGWQQERISDMAVNHWFGAWDYSSERYRLTGRAARVDTSDDTRFTKAPEPSSEAMIELQNNATDWLFTAGLGHVGRLDGDELSTRFEARFQPLGRWQMAVGYHSGERSTDSAEAWWLVSRDSTSFEGLYQPDSRTTVGARLASLSFDAGSQSSVAEGQRLEVFGSHLVARRYPDWSVRAEYVLQDLNRLERLEGAVQSLFERPLQTGELLTEHYERVSVGMRWQEHSPHSLLEQQAQPGWFLDVNTGYVLSTDTVEYGLGGGVSWSLFGDDEIALSAGYASDSLSGDSSLDARVTYTLFFKTAGENR